MNLSKKYIIGLSKKLENVDNNVKVYKCGSLKYIIKFIIRITVMFSAIYIITYLPRMCYHPNNYKYECNYLDNLKDTDEYMRYAIYSSTITFIIYLIFSIYELSREHFIKKHFQVNDKVPLDYISSILSNYSKLNIKLNTINMIYKFLCKIFLIFFLCNLSFSSFVYFHINNLNWSINAIFFILNAATTGIDVIIVSVDNIEKYERDGILYGSYDKRCYNMIKQSYLVELNEIVNRSDNNSDIDSDSYGDV